MKKILTHFQQYDPVLSTHFLRLKDKIQPIQKQPATQYFHQLCREIICQQLSGASGSAIFNRFLQLFPSGKVKPADIVATTHEQLRLTGMSNAKARYVRNLAENVLQSEVHIDDLDTLTDEAIITELTKVKGIGPWTAEMFLLFTLGREDVFSFGDLGLKKGLMKIYDLKEAPTKEYITALIARWSPYKSYASLTLWAALDEE